MIGQITLTMRLACVDHVTIKVKPQMQMRVTSLRYLAASLPVVVPSFQRSRIAMCSNLPRPKHHAIKLSQNSSNFSHDQLPESIWHLGNLVRSLRLPVDAEPTRYFLALQLSLRPGTWHLAPWQKKVVAISPSDDPLAQGEISAPVPGRSMET